MHMQKINVKGRFQNTAMWVRASLFRRFTDTNVYGTVSVKKWKNSPQNVGGYADIFTV